MLQWSVLTFNILAVTYSNLAIVCQDLQWQEAVGSFGAFGRCGVAGFAALLGFADSIAWPSYMTNTRGLEHSAPAMNFMIVKVGSKTVGSHL